MQSVTGPRLPGLLPRLHQLETCVMVKPQTSGAFPVWNALPCSLEPQRVASASSRAAGRGRASALRAMPTPTLRPPTLHPPPPPAAADGYPSHRALHPPPPTSTHFHPPPTRSQRTSESVRLLSKQRARPRRGRRKPGDRGQVSGTPTRTWVGSDPGSPPRCPQSARAGPRDRPGPARRLVPCLDLVTSPWKSY